MFKPAYLKPESAALVALMSAFVALGPLSTDMYLPALPAMVAGFDTTLSSVQLTVSAYLMGFASFHLFCGPLADRFGRKPVLLLGMVVFFVSCLGCATASTIEQLTLFRFLQGIGACTGPTLARAMIRDIYGPAEAARALGYVAAIMALAPVIAPTLGGWMLTWLPWPSIFWFLAVYSVLAMASVVLKLPESLPSRQSLRPAVILHNYRRLLRDRHYLLSVFALSCLYSGAFAFISGSSFVLINFMGVKPEHFGLWFMAIVSGYMSGSVITARFAHRFRAQQLMLGGSLTGLLSGLLMVLASLWGFQHPLAVILPMAFYTLAVGVTMPHAMSAALAAFPEMAGTASSLLGFIQMALAAAAGLVVGAALDSSALPMALVITACGGLSCLGFLLRGRQLQGHAVPESI